MTHLPEAALRAFLVHDAGETTRLTRQLGADAMRDYQYLANAALSLIAGWRFRQGYSDADVVRCVAAIRLARTADGDGSSLQPAVAENVLRHALGQDVPDTTDHVERFRAVIALLDALAEGALPGEEDVDHLLTQARTLADRWAANDQPLYAASSARPGGTRHRGNGSGARSCCLAHAADGRRDHVGGCARKALRRQPHRPGTRLVLAGHDVVR